MRKQIATLLLAFMATSVWAVDLPKQGFGLQIGWAQPILRINDANHKDTLNNVIKMNGLKIGVLYDASYIAGFGSTMGINYTFGVSNGGGWKSKYPQFGDYPKERRLITYHELEVFVDWQYKFEIAKETYLTLYTGPTIQCGLDLSMRIDRREEDATTGDITTIYGDNYSGFNNDKPDQQFKRLNVTWGVGAAFQYKRYFLRGGYDFGLLNPHKNADYTTGIHSRGRLDQWSIKIGMYLWYAD